MTRIERIVREYFAPYNRTVTDDDFDYVMEFVKVLLMKAGKYQPAPSRKTLRRPQ